MSTEALLLALTTVIRPTTLAALFAILATRNPQRLLVAYLVVGAAFSLAVGAVVVVLLQGLISETASSAPRPILDLVLGGAALGYAAAAWAGWAPRRRTVGAAGGAAGASTGGPAAWMQRRLQRLTVRGAAAAGVLTHLPGLVYLAALNAIVGSATDAVDGCCSCSSTTPSGSSCRSWHCCCRCAARTRRVTYSPGSERGAATTGGWSLWCSCSCWARTSS